MRQRASNPRWIQAVRWLAVALALGGAHLAVSARDSFPTAYPDGGAALAAHQKDAPYSPLNQQGQAVYIVQFDDAPVATYGGDVPGYGAISISAAPGAKRDVHSPQAEAYRAYLADRQALAFDAIRAACGRDPETLARFNTALNGLALKLSPMEAERIRSLPGVLAVERETIHYPQSDRSAEFTNATPIWTGDILPTSPTLATLGEGMVIGIIDTGITPENPSFADMDSLGYVLTNPRGRLYGVGDPDHPEYDPEFPLNAKLIGAYDMVPVSDPQVPYDPREYKSHGSHVASTAAGSFTTATLPLSGEPGAVLSVPVSGIAPRANIITYRIEHPNGGGRTAAILAAIEQAILDEIDVINYSYSVGMDSPWENFITVAFHSAVEAGVLVVTSSGNDGPGFRSVPTAKAAPWMTVVANSTHDRVAQNAVIGLTREDGVALDDLTGPSMTGPYGPAPIVFAGDYENPNDPDGDPAQAMEPFPAGTFDGEIVVVHRGTIARVDKGWNVLQGGAGGMSLINLESNGNHVVVDSHYLPAVHLNYEQGLALKAWLGEGTGHAGAIAGTFLSYDADAGDQVAWSSSRGPAGSHAIIRPDIAAPGSDILAAVPAYPDGSPCWDFYSGTSMASPNVAGAGVLLRSLYPDWTPMEVRSAMMLTATPVMTRMEDGAPATAYDMGAGRIDVARAARTGLIMDISSEAMMDANPAWGGNVTTLNMPSIVRISLDDDTFTRIVRSAVSVPVTWTVSTESDAMVSVSVEPETFTLAPGAEQELTITVQMLSVDYDNLERIGEGSVRLTPDNSAIPEARMPVALQVVPIKVPDDRLELDQAPAVGSTVIAGLRAVEIEDLTIETFGPVPASVSHGYLHQGLRFSQDLQPSPRNGLAEYGVSVEEGCRMLAVDILETSSYDLDLIIVHQASGKMYQVATDLALETFFLANPAAGDYRVLVHNYLASDQERDNPDFFRLAIATVYETDGSGGLTVEETLGRTQIPAGEPFDLELSWDVSDGRGYHHYGLATLGPDADHPGMLGAYPVILHLENEPDSPTLSGQVRLTDGRELDDVPARLHVHDHQGIYVFTIDGDGHYAFRQPEGWSGSVTPHMEGWTDEEDPVLAGYYFAPLRRSYESLDGPRFGEDFLGQPRPMDRDAFEQYYKVVYRPQGSARANPDGWAYGSVGMTPGAITIRHSSERDTLKIVRRPQYRNTPSEELPPIGAIYADDGLRMLHSEAWIGNLHSYNQFTNVTLRNAGLLKMEAATFGSLRITNRAPVPYNQVYIDLKYPLPPHGVAAPNARIHLVGYQLAGLLAPDQDFQFIQSASRKSRADGAVHVIPGGIVRDVEDPHSYLYVAGLRRLSVTGASVTTDLLMAMQLGQVRTRGMVYTGPGLRAPIPGHLSIMNLMALEAPQARIQAVAGNIGASFLAIGGDLPALVAKYRPAIGGGFVGYGPDDTPGHMMVVTGMDDAWRGNIGIVHGDRGVTGTYLAGVSLWMGGESMANAGLVRRVSTGRNGTLEGTVIFMQEGHEPQVLPRALRGQVMVNDEYLN